MIVCSNIKETYYALVEGKALAEELKGKRYGVGVDG